MIPHPFRIAAGLAFGVALGGCVSIEQIAPRVTPQMASLGGTSTNALELGRSLYTGRCAACHSIDPVAKYSVAEWHTIIDDMTGKAKLTPSEKSALVAYVKAARGS